MTADCQLMRTAVGMELSSLLFLISLLSFSSAFNRQYIEGSDSAYTCNCVLRDEFLPSTTTTTTSQPQIDSSLTEGSSPRLPTRFWSLYNENMKKNDKIDLLSSSFIDRVLSVFRRRKMTTTTQSPLEPQNDVARDAIAGLGRTILTKYMAKLRRDWNMLDRFVCRCQGDLLKVLKARNYVSLTILHD